MPLLGNSQNLFLFYSQKQQKYISSSYIVYILNLGSSKIQENIITFYFKKPNNHKGIFDLFVLVSISSAKKLFS